MLHPNDPPSCGDAADDLIDRLNDPHRRLTVSDRQEAAIEIARLRAAQEWQDISTAPKEGVFQIWAPNAADGSKPYSAGNSNVSVMFRSPNMSLIDAHFHYDMPRPTHWAPVLPEPSGTLIADHRTK